MFLFVTRFVYMSEVMDVVSTASTHRDYVMGVYFLITNAYVLIPHRLDTSTAGSELLGSIYYLCPNMICQPFSGESPNTL